MIKPAGPEKISYDGKIIQVVTQPMNVGSKVVTFEKARRSPGTRLLIVKNDEMLISKEYRLEQDRHDYRLPGGKVFDTLAEYVQADGQEILQYAEKGAKKEALEEVGIRVENMELIKVSKSGATVEWDLYYFVVNEFSENESGAKLEEGESITHEWYSFDEVKKLCIDGSIGEDRSVGVILRYILQRQS